MQRLGSGNGAGGRIEDPPGSKEAEGLRREASR
jgi:hypothetical protein